jgi:hypothetical protein
VSMRVLVASFGAVLAVAAAFPAAGGATNECHGIQACISVPGPWVVVTRPGETQYLLACPNGQGIVAGLDVQATSRSVRVSFDGRVGAPVAPGVTTTRSALFRALSLVRSRQAFQPLIGCVRGGGGGGRSTVSARVKPTPGGAPLERFAQTVVVHSGLQRTASVRCPRNERYVGSWSALAFRTKQPPSLAQADEISIQKVVIRGRVRVVASASDALSPDAHAVVQAGVECAP